MKLVERFWTAVSYLGSILTFSPFHNAALHQSPLSSHINAPDLSVPWPRFYPPTGPADGFPGDDFFCDYPEMKGWESCAGTSNQCWLRNKATGEEFNITSNYEDFAPIGINRYYELDMADGHWDADGINFENAKLFNNSYPGPWLQACWGDTMEVKIWNHLKRNGTSVHWHGIRMNQTMHMDGVNGVSQCPTAPGMHDRESTRTRNFQQFSMLIINKGDYFTYKFNVTQYGSSWYHSHYSLQYADGIAGPLTFHGPTADDFDEAKKPFLMTDWYHNSAFWAITQPDEQPDGTPTINITRPSILINGRGDCRTDGWENTTAVYPPYNITFAKKEDHKRPKRYLLRVFNTAFDTTFIFSIDNHVLQVVSADFVPIHSYKATSILVGIGQRYHVIVEADPVAYGDNTLPADGNFWIRTYIAKCFKGYIQRPDGYERTAVLRYDPTSKALPQTNSWGNINFGCQDEPSSRLKPIHEWKIGYASNGDKTSNWGEEFDIVGNINNLPTPKHYPLAYFSLGNWSDWNPMRVSYEDPIFLELDQFGKEWPKEWSVIPEDYGPDDWVYLVLDGTSGASSFGAHPMHLHGHDFALLQTSQNVPFSLDAYKPNFNNPPRRDVVLLPAQGFVVIAFKTDNPGSWLLHCHIAAHASEGLGFQIMERQEAASKLWPPGSEAQMQVKQHCDKWYEWHNNTDNWSNPHIFQDDSGI